MNEITKANTKNVRVGLDELLELLASTTAKLPGTDLDVELSFKGKQITIKIVLNGQEICNQAFSPSLPGIPLPLLNPQATSVQPTLAGTTISTHSESSIDIKDDKQQIDLSKSLKMVACVKLELNALVGKNYLEINFSIESGDLSLEVTLNDNKIISQDFHPSLPAIQLNKEARKFVRDNSINLKDGLNVTLKLL